MKKYQKDLKQLREQKADQILKDDLIDKYGLRKGLLKEITLIQNSSRGRIFEIMGEVTIAKVFDVEDFDKQKVFNTPYGKRRIDLYSKEKGVIIEVKSGYARSKAFIRKQIQKDLYILENESHIKKAVWICFRGATKPLMKLLENSNIDYVDMEYDKMEIDSKSEKTVIRV
jgi:hypothetical protein